VVTPKKRGGLAGIVDEFRDAVAGQAPGKIFTDADGNEYIKHPDSTGNKWLRIVGTAVRGAAAGAAVGQGPGGKARAAEAGIQAGDKIAQQRQQQEKDQSGEVKNAQLEKFNSIKLKHDMVAQEFQLQRLKAKGTQEDIKFSQEQLDREQGLIEKGLGADLGIYKDEADFTRVKEAHPEFWKDTYAGGHGRTVPVAEVDPATGERLGVHVFLHMPGVNSTLEPAGTTIKVAIPPQKPGDPWTLGEQTPTVPLTTGQKFAYDTAAYNQVHKAEADAAEVELKKQQTAEAKANASKAPSEIAKNNAEAAKAKAEATAAGPSDPALIDSIRKGVVAPESLSRMLGGKQGQKLLSDVEAAGDVDTSKLAAYPKMYADFTSGKTAQQRQNLDTAFKTINDLTSLNTYSSRLPVGPARTAWDNKLTTASAEIANGLAKPGATATKEEIAQVRKSLDTKFSRQSALDTQIGSLIEQYGAMRDKWREGAPTAAYEAKMPDVGARAKEIMYKHDPEQVRPLFGVPYYDRPGGRLIGFSRDGGKTLEPAQ
jgi:hypothetical protein